MGNYVTTSMRTIADKLGELIGVTFGESRMEGIQLSFPISTEFDKETIMETVKNGIVELGFELEEKDGVIYRDANLRIAPQQREEEFVICMGLSNQ